MPKWPVVSGAQIVRALERLGFRQVRQRGSHVIMRREERGCAVPLHKEVRIGTLGTILRQAEIAPDDFFKVVK